ncbi:MAG: aldose 1-epimerase family protein [Hyphomicrobiales bacterium]|nr:aldose 1-epimerase family protein [Hyphomicrobiales bacterium]
MDASPNQVTLHSGSARLVVARRGAEAKAWSIGGQDLLWSGDLAFWGETAPILFPVVGWLADGVRIGGKRHPLGLHGFARGRDFRIEAAEARHVRLALEDDSNTRALYPFAFRMTVDYRLKTDALEVVLNVENRGAAPMPYACGLHPGFRWPLTGGGRDDSKIVFSHHEAAQVPVIATGGLIGRATKPIPIKGRTLPLSDALFANDAVCFIDAKSDSLRYVDAKGAAIAMEFQDFPHLALWSRPGAGFVCIEAWTGHSDPQGFSGELSDKPSMRTLAPGKSGRHRATYSFHPAAK